MAIDAEHSARPARRIPWRSIVAGLAMVVSVVVAASWWFTAPIESPAKRAGGEPATKPTPGATVTDAKLAWPAEKLEGDEAKRFLLAFLETAVRRVDATPAYTATFRKHERVRGTLLPEQTLAMKVRNQPFAVYFKFVEPHAGKEVIYAEGHNDGKVIAHNNDISRRFIPRLAVAPDSPTALAESRHPVTDAGLSNLAHRLLNFRKLDLDDSDAVTILDVAVDDAGRKRLRSTHLHTHKSPSRPYTKVVVLYDPELQIPVEITSYDWPEPGDEGQPRLAERYRYDDLKLDAPLTAIDFDPANPAYEFRRY